jgi:hypothetical protein
MPRSRSESAHAAITPAQLLNLLSFERELIEALITALAQRKTLPARFDQYNCDNANLRT